MAILALEPDPSQATAIRRVVGDLVGAPLTVVASIEQLLQAVRDDTPELILLPPLVSPAEEAELIAVLRSKADASHVQTLVTPVLNAQAASTADRSWLRWGRASAGPSTPSESHAFAERIAWTLERVRESRAAVRQADLAETLAIVAPDVAVALPPAALSPVASTSVVMVDPPPSLIDFLAAVSDRPASAPQPGAAARLLKKMDDDRREHRRFSASELRGIRSARIKFGPQVTLVDVSAGGALLETDARLHPHSEAALELIGETRNLVVPFRVLRSQITALGDSPRYRGACVFATPLDLDDLVIPGVLDAIEEAIPDAHLAAAVMTAPPRLVVRNAW